MHRTLIPLLCLTLLTAACGGTEDGICTDTAEHLRSCFGDTAASSYLSGSCNPDSAYRLLSLDCKGLSQAVLGGKADELGVEEAVREAVRQAIREAVMQAMQQVWEQVVGALGMGSLTDRPLYLQFYKSSSKSKAQSRADELASAMAGDPDFRPMVVKTGWFSYAVVHGPCPLDPGSDLPRKVADLVMNNPELIKALGGELKTEPTDEGMEVHMSLPLTLLSFDADTPATLGCTSYSSGNGAGGLGEEPGYNDEPGSGEEPGFGDE